MLTHIRHIPSAKRAEALPDTAMVRGALTCSRLMWPMRSSATAGGQLSAAVDNGRVYKSPQWWRECQALQAGVLGALRCATAASRTGVVLRVPLLAWSRM